MPNTNSMPPYTVYRNVLLDVDPAMGIAPSFQGSAQSFQLPDGPTTAAGGNVTLLPGGGFKYMPAKWFLGDDDFKVVAVGAGGLQSPAIRVRVTVTGAW